MARLPFDFYHCARVDSSINFVISMDLHTQPIYCCFFMRQRTPVAESPIFLKLFAQLAQVAEIQMRRV